MDTNSEKLNTPLVSILMLNYNKGRFIKEAIESVLSQTFRDFELIVIDDASSDDSVAIVASLDDDRIHFIKHDENAGLFVRRNESLALARGKYVAVLDSDDIWISPQKLEKQVEFMETNQDYALVGTFVNVIGEAGKNLKKYSYRTKDKNIRHSILLKNQFTHSAVLMRHESVQKTRGYYEGLAEDLELFLQLGNWGRLANLPIYATAHRVVTGSANDRGPKMASAVLNIVKMHPEYPRRFLGLIFAFLRLQKAKFGSK